MSAAEETVLPDAPDAPAPADQEAKETVHAVPATTSVPAALPEARPKSARERKAVEVFKPEAPKVADHTIQQVTLMNGPLPPPADLTIVSIDDRAKEPNLRISPTSTSASQATLRAITR